MEERGYNLRQRPLPVSISDQSSLPIPTTPTADSLVSSGLDQLPTMAHSATSSVLNPTHPICLNLWLRIEMRMTFWS